MIELKETVAVVTGGSRGIGRSVVKQMAAAGAKVVFSYASDLPAARSIVAEVESAGGTPLRYRRDIRGARRPSPSSRRRKRASARSTSSSTTPASGTPATSPSRR